MTFEDRLDIIERELAAIKRQVSSLLGRSWVDRVLGSFADEPEFDEVLRLGRELRAEQERIP